MLDFIFIAFPFPKTFNKEEAQFYFGKKKSLSSITSKIEIKSKKQRLHFREVQMTISTQILLKR